MSIRRQAAKGDYQRLADYVQVICSCLLHITYRTTKKRFSNGCDIFFEKSCFLRGQGEACVKFAIRCKVVYGGVDFSWQSAIKNRRGVIPFQLCLTNEAILKIWKTPQLSCFVESRLLP
jgi:hypothetical protein